MPFVPPPELIVYESPHWRINHRVECVLPGYLMIEAADPKAVELTEVGTDALSEIGHLLGRVTGILRNQLGAEKVYISRYGHDKRHAFHFHVIPVYPWVFAAYRDTAPAGVPHGADITRFIWREYCEKNPPPLCPGCSVAEAIAIIRKGFDWDRRGAS